MSGVRTPLSQGPEGQSLSLGCRALGGLCEGTRSGGGERHGRHPFSPSSSWLRRPLVSQGFLARPLRVLVNSQELPTGLSGQLGPGAAGVFGGWVPR